MNLYRRSTLQASVVILLAGIVGLTAATAQRRKPHQLRATALLEFSREGSADKPRLVPITILDEGSFHDASIYKSTPEPMAVGEGVIYEAQKTGQIVGYFTVGKATKGPIWTAMGRWAVVSASPKTQTAPSSSAGGTSASVDERPILHRAGSSPSEAPSASPTPGSGTPSGSSDDRPVLHRPPTDTSAQSSPSPAATPSPAPAAAAPEPEPADPNRPTLRRRTSRSEQSEPSASTPAPATPTAPKPAAPAPSAPRAGEVLVAVSDAQPSESRSYEFIWKAGEREAIEAKMRRLALAQLPNNNGNASLTEKSLSNVIIRTFDLDLSNDAVVVLTAEVPPGNAPPANRPGSKAGSKTVAKSAVNAAPAPTVTRYITLIARVDFQGNPLKLAASVTDSSRLDVTPRLELIDAVDVDGDSLGELLFRQYSFDDKSFVIFKIGRSTVTKMFEGASQPLK